MRPAIGMFGILGLRTPMRRPNKRTDTMMLSTKFALTLALILAAIMAVAGVNRYKSPANASALPFAVIATIAMRNLLLHAQPDNAQTENQENRGEQARKNRRDRYVHVSCLPALNAVQSCLSGGRVSAMDVRSLILSVHTDSLG